MQVGAAYGYECRSCRTRYGAIAVVGESPTTCPTCNKPLTPVPGPNAPDTLINFRCSNCGTSIGMYTSTEPSKACPSCGKPIQ